MGDYDTDAAAKRCADVILSSHEEARRTGIAEGLEAAARVAEDFAPEPGTYSACGAAEEIANDIRALDPAQIAAQREGGRPC